jgi:hypothetical protein
MTIDDSKLGSINTTGAGNIVVNVDDGSSDLSNVNIDGTITINDSTADDTITGSSKDDTLNISGGSDSVNLGAGDDSVVLDFSNLSTIDGGSGSDTISLTGSATVTTDGDTFSGAQNATGIEVLDLTALNSGAGFSSDDSIEFNFSTSLLDSLLGSSSGDLTLKLTAEQAEDIQFTTSDNQVHDTTTAGSSSIEDATTYALDADTNLVIDII